MKFLWTTRQLSRAIVYYAISRHPLPLFCTCTSWCNSLDKERNLLLQFVAWWLKTYFIRQISYYNSFNRASIQGSYYNKSTNFDPRNILRFVRIARASLVPPATLTQFWYPQVLKVSVVQPLYLCCCWLVVTSKFDNVTYTEWYKRVGL